METISGSVLLSYIRRRKLVLEEAMDASYQMASDYAQDIQFDPADRSLKDAMKNEAQIDELNRLLDAIKDGTL